MTDAALAARLSTDKVIPPQPAPAHPTSMYDFTVNGIQEATVPLSRYKGQVVMVVNVASK